MKFGAMKTWMIAGVIALAGGTTAFVALDVTGTDNTPTPFVAQSEPAAVQANNEPSAAATNLEELFVETVADALVEADTAAEALVEVAEIVVETAETTDEGPAVAQANDAIQVDGNVAVNAPVNVNGGDVRDYLRESTNGVTADLLSLTVDELTAARDAGQSTGDLLTAAGISRETHQAAMVEAWPSIVQAGIDAGIIGTEQAADLLEEGPRLRNGNQNNPNNNNDGDGDRDGNGRGRGRGNGGNNQGNPPPGGNA